MDRGTEVGERRARRRSASQHRRHETLAAGEESRVESIERRGAVRMAMSS